MAKTADTPDYSVRHTAKLGKVVHLDGYIVPETVVTTLTGGGEIDGRRWPDMSFTFSVRDGAAMCTEFRITSKEGDRPVRTPDLRFINLDDLAQLAFMAHAGTQIGPGHYANKTELDPEAGRQIRRKIDASYSEPLEELRQVARIYCDPANRKAPAHNVYFIMGYGSKETANRRIKVARSKGLIPKVKATDSELDEQFQKLTQ